VSPSRPVRASPQHGARARLSGGDRTGYDRATAALETTRLEVERAPRGGDRGVMSEEKKRRGSRAWLPAGVVLLQGVLWWRAVEGFSRLPAEIPLRFGGDGRPSRWVPATWENWLILPGIAALLLLILGGLSLALGSLAVRTPSWVNLPQRELFRRLSPEGRRRAIEPLRTLLLGIAGLYTAFSIWVLDGITRVALGEVDQIGSLPPIALVVGTVLIALLGHNGTRRAVEAEASREGILSRSEE
jgi:uncharacterized membrane protein